MPVIGTCIFIAACVIIGLAAHTDRVKGHQVDDNEVMENEGEIIE